MARREQPDVALVDYNLPGEDGLTLCRRLRALPRPPRVVIYSAYDSDGLVVPAILAGAKGLVDKGSDPDELFEAIRTVASGADWLPAVRPELLEVAGTRIEQRDLPILGMLTQGVLEAEVADVLSFDHPALDERLEAMLGRLRPGGPARLAG
jgi:DNA-binding NarL/FixJ family response regulator